MQYNSGPALPITDDGRIARQQTDVLGTSLGDQHSIERITVEPGDRKQLFAVLRADRQQLETLGKLEKAKIAADAADRYQDGNFPEGDRADKAKLSSIERPAFC